MESVNISLQYLKTNIEGYKQLFLLENYLRGKIDEILTKNLGVNYFAAGIFCFTDSKNQKIDVYQKAYKRFDKSIKNKIIFDPDDKIINHIDFNDISVLIKEKWSILKVFFPSGWDINHIKSKLSSLEPIRNKIAHNRLIREIELEEIKTVFDYFLRNLENKTLEKYLPVKIKIISEEEKNEMIKEIYEIQKQLKNASVINTNLDIIIEKIKSILIQNNIYTEEVNREVINLYKDLDKYVKQPRILGKNRELKSFITENKLIQRFDNLLILIK